MSWTRRAGPPAAAGGRADDGPRYGRRADDLSERDLLMQVITKLDTALDLIADHEIRMRGLEVKVWQWSGVVAIAGGGLGAVLTKLFGH